MVEWYEDDKVLAPDSIQATGNPEEFVAVGFVLDKTHRERAGGIFLLVEQSGDVTLSLTAGTRIWERVISMLTALLEKEVEDG